VKAYNLIPNMEFIKAQSVKMSSMLQDIIDTISKEEGQEHATRLAVEAKVKAQAVIAMMCECAEWARDNEPPHKSAYWVFDNNGEPHECSVEEWAKVSGGEAVEMVIPLTNQEGSASVSAEGA